MEPETLFKVSKKRKTFRRRPNDVVDHETGLVSGTAVPEGHAENESFAAIETDDSAAPSGIDLVNESELNTLPVSKILQLRRHGRNRRHGIEFSTVSGDTEKVRDLTTSGSGGDVQVHGHDKINALEAAASRFARQTGQVADANNSHMTAFIDAEMAKLRTGDKSNLSSSSIEVSGSYGSPEERRMMQLPDRQPAALGRLQEIDLGPDSSLRNIEMTQEATRRLATGETLQLQHPTSSAKLGKDGKPRRRRRRRNSEDLKRDELVEAVLRESKIDMYDDAEQNVVADEDQAADDRIAEEFRRQFMDAIQSRNNRRSGPSNSTAKNKTKSAKPDERPRGPKLGGSRSARAAMRAMDDKTTRKR